MKKRRLLFILPALFALGACEMPDFMKDMKLPGFVEDLFDKEEAEDQTGDQEDDEDQVAVSITNKANFELVIGGTKQLEAVLKGATGTLTWASDTISVATVDQTGKVTAVAAGTSTISVSFGTHSDSVVVTVKEAEVPPMPVTFEDAYKEAEKLSNDGKSETAEAYTLTGVVAARQGNSFFMQNGAYCIEIYNKKINDAPAVIGKEVTVVTTLQNYYGNIESKTITSVEYTGNDGTITPVSVPDKAALDAARINMPLAPAKLTVVSKGDVYAANSKDGKLTVTIGEDTGEDKNVTLIMSKYCVNANAAAVLASVQVGDKLNVNKAICAAYKGAMQISLSDDSVVTVDPHLVENVTLDKTTLSLEAGAQPVQLTPTISPANATNKAVTWSSNNESVATVVDGLVTPVAAGEATITVTTADGEKTATCVVTVTAATKTLAGITVKTQPSKVKYEVGQTFDPSGMVLEATYSDESKEDITAGYTFSPNTALALTDTSVTITYQDQTAIVSITVVEHLPVVEEGYYKISSVADNTTYYLQSNGTTAAPTAVTNPDNATIFKFELIEGSFNTYKITLAEDSTKMLYANSSNNGLRIGTTSDTWVISEGTVEGTGDYDMVDTVQSRYLSLYNKQDFRTYLSSSPNSIKSASLLQAEFKEVSKIEVTTGPDKTSYYVGDEFDPTGMVVHVTYSDGTEENITEGFTWSPKSFEAVNAEKDITITYCEKNAHIKVCVVADDRTISSIKFADNCDMTKKTYDVGDDWDPAGLKVVAVRSDNSEFELEAKDVTFTYDKTTEAAAESLTLNVTAHYKVDDQTTLDTQAKSITVVVKEKEAGEKVVIDGTNLTSTATTANTDVDCGGIICTMSAGAKQQSSSGENKFSEKAILIGKNGAYIFNKNAIPGKITKFEIYVNKGASTKFTFGIVFSDSPISEYSTGDHTATFGDGSSLGLDQVYDASDKLTDNCQYFWYQVTNANNSQVQFRITYTPNA